MTTLYDSRQPLVCCEFKDLNRQIGILVTGPFQHHGLPGKPLCADLYYEVVSGNTIGYGSVCPIGELNPHVEGATAQVVAKLNGVIEELERHRDRLAAEMFRLTDEPAVDVSSLITGHTEE